MALYGVVRSCQGEVSGNADWRKTIRWCIVNGSLASRAVVPNLSAAVWGQRRFGFVVDLILSILPINSHHTHFLQPDTQASNQKSGWGGDMCSAATKIWVLFLSVSLSGQRKPETYPTMKETISAFGTFERLRNREGK